MGFTYSLTTSIGKVRLLIPDNNSAAYYLEDAEIQYFLDEAGSSVKGAAIAACKWLARKFATMVSFEADGTRIEHSERATAFAARAKELQAELFGGMTSLDLTRTDGYHEYSPTAEDSSEYESDIVYVRVK
jgi:hypothetical protein